MLAALVVACGSTEPAGPRTDFGTPEPGVIAQPTFVDLRTRGVTENCPACSTANTLAIKNAIAASSAGGLELHFPMGIIYLDEGTVTSNIGYKTSILVEGQHDLVFSGEGMFATTLEAHGHGDGLAWDIMEVGKGSQRIEIKNLGFKWDTITSPPDQDHGHELQVTANTGAANNTQFVIVHDVFFGPSIGDAFRVSGTTQIVEHAKLLDFIIDDGGQANFPLGARSGVAFQRGYNDVEIGRGFIRGAKNSCIDFEPSGEIVQNGVGFHDLWIDNSLGQTFTPVSWDGTSATTPAKYGYVRDVWVFEGQVQFINTDHWIVEGLHVIDTGAGPEGADSNGPLVLIYQYNHDLVIRDIDVQRLSGSTPAGLIQISALNLANMPIRVTFEGGTLLEQTHGIGVQADNCDQCTFRGMTLRWEGPTPSTTYAWTTRSDLTDMTNVVFDNNLIISPPGKLQACFYVSAISNNISSVSVIHNRAPNACSTGVKLQGNPPHNIDTNPQIEDNDFDGSTIATIDHGPNTAPITAGNRGGASQRRLESFSAPEGAFTGNQGDVFTFVNGDATARYIKVTGTGNTGWRSSSDFPSGVAVPSGHVVTTGSTTAVTNCGTGGGVSGNDIAGVITEGSATSGCTLFFAAPYADTPTCVVTSEAGLGLSFVPATTKLTITNIGALSGTKLDYTCAGHL